MASFFGQLFYLIISLKQVGPTELGAILFWQTNPRSRFRFGFLFQGEYAPLLKKLLLLNKSNTPMNQKKFGRKILI